MTVQTIMTAIRDVLRSDDTNLPTALFKLTNKGIYTGKKRDDATKGPLVIISYPGLGDSEKLNFGRNTYKEDIGYVIRIAFWVRSGKTGTIYLTMKEDDLCLYAIDKIKTSLKENQATLATDAVRTIIFQEVPEEPREFGDWWRQNLLVVCKE